MFVKMKRAILIPLVLIAGFSKLPAQSIIQVSPLTGAVNSSIPIWNISSGDISASIALSYTAGNGMKVNDLEGSAGMDWVLSVGGSASVNREVRGLPDDFVGSMSTWM